MSYRGASLAEHRLALGSIDGTWSRARCNTRDSAFLGTGQILFPHILEPFHSLKFVSAVCIPPELWSRLYQVPSQRLAPFHVPMLPRLVPRGGRSFHGLWQGHTARSHCSLYLYLRYSLREAYFVLDYAYLRYFTEFSILCSSHVYQILQYAKQLTKRIDRREMSGSGFGRSHIGCFCQ